MTESCYNYGQIKSKSRLCLLPFLCPPPEIRPLNGKQPSPIRPEGPVLGIYSSLKWSPPWKSKAHHGLWPLSHSRHQSRSSCCWACIQELGRKEGQQVLIMAMIPLIFVSGSKWKEDMFFKRCKEIRRKKEPGKTCWSQVTWYYLLPRITFMELQGYAGKERFLHSLTERAAAWAVM